MSKTSDKRRVVKPAAKVLKPVPVFASEAEERLFWETHDSTDTWTGAEPNASTCPS